MKKRNFLKAAVAAVPAAFIATTANAGEMGPVLAVVSHPVTDYAAWRVVYDSAEPIRQKAGVTAARGFPGRSFPQGRDDEGWRHGTADSGSGRRGLISKIRWRRQ